MSTKLPASFADLRLANFAETSRACRTLFTQKCFEQKWVKEGLTQKCFELKWVKAGLTQNRFELKWVKAGQVVQGKYNPAVLIGDTSISHGYIRFEHNMKTEYCVIPCYY